MRAAGSGFCRGGKREICGKFSRGGVSVERAEVAEVGVVPELVAGDFAGTDPAAAAFGGLYLNPPLLDAVADDLDVAVIFSEAAHAAFSCISS
jgi:hypothetical protein